MLVVGEQHRVDGPQPLRAHRGAGRLVEDPVAHGMLTGRVEGRVRQQVQPPDPQERGRPTHNRIPSRWASVAMPRA